MIHQTNKVTSNSFAKRKRTGELAKSGKDFEPFSAFTKVSLALKVCCISRSKGFRDCIPRFSQKCTRETESNSQQQQRNSFEISSVFLELPERFIDNGQCWLKSRYAKHRFRQMPFYYNRLKYPYDGHISANTTTETSFCMLGHKQTCKLVVVYNN